MWRGQEALSRQDAKRAGYKDLPSGKLTTKCGQILATTGVAEHPKKGLNNIEELDFFLDTDRN